MKKTILCFFTVFLAAVFALTGCGTESPTQPAQTQTGTTSAERRKTHTFSGFDPEIADTLTDVADTAGAVGVQLAMLDGNSIKTFSYGYENLAEEAEVTEDTKYRVASLSKLVTAVVFMVLQEKGYVDENEDIAKYFDESCRNPAYPHTAITPGMLMTHTSSLESDAFYEYYDGLLSNPGVYLPFAPGTQYEYSNFGYGVLSCVMERAVGKPFNTLAKTHLFEPLGIDASYIYNELENTENVGTLYNEGGLSVHELSGFDSAGEGKDLTLACGNLIISAKDYAKILGMLIHEGSHIDRTRVLTEESVQALLTPRFSLETESIAYGSVIRTDVIEDRSIYIHTGSAYGMFSAFAFDPESKKAAVVLSTGEARREDEKTGVYELCLQMIRAVWGDADPPAPPEDALPQTQP